MRTGRRYTRRLTYQRRGFTGEELTEVLKALTSRKPSGVDDVPAELLKWLDGEGRGLLLEVLDKIFNTGAFPE